MGRAVILCPLKREARAVRHAVGTLGEVVVCGPGPEAVRRVCRDILAGDDGKETPALVLLCGLGGGLAACSRVPRIVKVVDRDASAFVPSVVIAAGDESEPPVVLLGLDEPVTTPERKRTQAQTYGAAIVDCESHAFGRLMSEAGVRWGVIRGVSDGPEDRLPEDIGSWVTARGGVKLWYVVFRLIVQPTLVPVIVRVGWNSGKALRVVGMRARELLTAEEAAVPAEGVTP